MNWENLCYELTKENAEFLVNLEEEKIGAILKDSIQIFLHKHEFFENVLLEKDCKKRTKKFFEVGDFSNVISKYIKDYKNNEDWYFDNIYGNDENQNLYEIISQESVDMSFGYFDSLLTDEENKKNLYKKDWIYEKKPKSDDFYSSSDRLVYTDEIIKKEILSLSYKEFLNTAYWRLVSKKVKDFYKNKCVVCDCEKNLNAHHKNYKRHGEEHLYWKQDIVCLCNECHKKFHKIKEN